MSCRYLRVWLAAVGNVQGISVGQALGQRDHCGDEIEEAGLCGLRQSVKEGLRHLLFLEIKLIKCDNGFRLMAQAAAHFGRGPDLGVAEEWVDHSPLWLGIAK